MENNRTEQIRRVVSRTQYMAIRYIEDRLEHKIDTSIDFTAIKNIIRLADDITILLLEYEQKLIGEGVVEKIEEIKEKTNE